MVIMLGSSCSNSNSNSNSSGNSSSNSSSTSSNNIHFLFFLAKRQSLQDLLRLEVKVSSLFIELGEALENGLVTYDPVTNTFILSEEGKLYVIRKFLNLQRRASSSLVYYFLLKYLKRLKEGERFYGIEPIFEEGRLVAFTIDMRLYAYPHKYNKRTVWELKNAGIIETLKYKVYRVNVEKLEPLLALKS